MAVADLLAEALQQRGDLAVRQLMEQVRAAGGHGVSRAAVERTLSADPRFQPVGDAGKPRWRLVGAADQPARAGQRDGAGTPGNPASGTTGTREALDALELRPWQAEAFAAWSQTGRGVVEAVTGTGKTRLAMAALRALADRGARTLVIVPTLELQEQWARELRAAVPELRIGRLGGGRDDDLFACEVVVATPHSAAAVPVDLPPGRPGLLIADEAHRYGAPTWGAALSPEFAFRLALTATYERGDDGVVEVLEPYFGDVVFRYGYDRAVADGTVAPFRIALVGVALTGAEQAVYDQLDLRVKQLHRELVGGLGMPREPRELFAAVAAVVAEAERGGRDGPQVRTCREYLVRVRERRDVGATAAGKLELCGTLGGALAGRRSLVFADTVEQAEAAATRLAAGGLRAETLHGELTTERRRIRLAVFRKGDLDALVAPRVLDEGVDVPAADVAVVLAAFRTRRQMVQRLGRVLRVKPDGGEARLILSYAIGTAEDPAVGGHRDFLADVREVARSVDRIGPEEATSRLLPWLEGPQDGGPSREG